MYKETRSFIVHSCSEYMHGNLSLDSKTGVGLQ